MAQGVAREALVLAQGVVFEDIVLLRQGAMRARLLCSRKAWCFKQVQVVSAVATVVVLSSGSVGFLFFSLLVGRAMFLFRKKGKKRGEGDCCRCCS